MLTLAAAPAFASAPREIRAISGADQQTTYSAGFPSPLVVWVVDPVTGRSIAGAQVHFTADSCIGLSAGYVVTNERGMAQVSATGLAPCSGKVGAEIEGDPEARVSFDGLVVNKAILTVIPIDMESKPGAVPDITDYYISGFVKGETEDSAHISGAPELTTTATSSSHYGNYAIKGGVGTLTADNYTFVPGFGTLAIIADPNSRHARDRQEDGLSLPQAKPDTTSVQPALENQLSVSAEFVGSAPRGSAIPVRKAIPQINSSASAAAHLSIAPVELPDFVAPGKRNSAAPIRAAIAPATMPGFSASQSKEAPSEVHAAIVPPATPATGPTSPAVTAPIHKAFNPPGVN